MESERSFARSIAMAVQNRRTDVEQWTAHDDAPRRQTDIEIELSNGQRFNVTVTEIGVPRCPACDRLVTDGSHPGCFSIRRPS